MTHLWWVLMDSSSCWMVTFLEPPLPRPLHPRQQSGASAEVARRSDQIQSTQGKANLRIQRVKHSWPGPTFTMDIIIVGARFPICSRPLFLFTYFFPWIGEQTPRARYHTQSSLPQGKLWCLRLRHGQCSITAWHQEGYRVLEVCYKTWQWANLLYYVIMASFEIQ